MSDQEPSVVSDAELVEQVRDQKRSALRLLWQRHASYATIVAEFQASRKGDIKASALLQSGFRAAHRRILDGEIPTTGFRPFLYSVMRDIGNGPRSGLRKRSNTPRDRRYTMDEVDQALAKAFSLMKARWREVLWYRHVEGMPPHLCAAELGLSSQSVSALCARADDALRASSLELLLALRPPSSACGSYREGILSPRPVGLITHSLDHPDTCTLCGTFESRAADPRLHLGRLLLPVVTGVLEASELQRRLVAASSLRSH